MTRMSCGHGVPEREAIVVSETISDDEISAFDLLFSLNKCLVHCMCFAKGSFPWL